MAMPICSAAFARGNRFRSCALLLWIAAAIVVLATQSATPLAAQAKTKVNPKDGLTYVSIPPGKFQMGCSPNDPDCHYDENPAHSVTLTKTFWIGQTPVTQAAYMKVISANPSTYKGDKLPVETVTWDNAQAYCAAVDMRLPTEAEYEYAARGGIATPRVGAVDDIAWYIMNSMGKTHEVGQKQANAYGLNDMNGNVWEWVADWYGPYDAAAATDPKGPSEGTFRVVRGNSWNYVAAYVRSSTRFRYVPGNHDGNAFIGFRCAGN